MEVFVYADQAEAQTHAAEKLNALLEANFGAPTLLLLAGGSSLALLDRVKAEFLGAHLTVGMSDERFSPDSKINNFAQMIGTPLYRNAVGRGCAFIDTRLKLNETLPQLGARMDSDLHAWRAANPEGEVLMTQGIGPDGHTCGIMPYPEDAELFRATFENADRWATGYDAKKKNEYPLRATVTLSFLRTQVASSVVYVVGSAKRKALKRVLAKEGSVHETPSWVLREMKEALLFTDQKT